MNSKCTEQIIERIRPLVESGLAWSKIAKAAGVSESSLHAWKRVGSKTFSQAFADMVSAAKEQFDIGLVRAGQFKQAQKHKLKKTTRELQNKGPGMPKTSYTKSVIVQYAKEILKLKLDMKMTKAAMLYKCERKVEKLEDWQMVKVKEEITEVDPNHQAVKNVETNRGKKKNEPWTFKDEHEHDVTDKLSKLLTEIGSNRSVLPKQEEIKKFETESDQG